MEDGFDKVLVHDLWLPLEQSLLYVEDGQVPHLLALVQECLDDPEEEGAPPAHLEVVLLEEVDQSDEGGPPDDEGTVLEECGHLGEEGIDQGGVANAHVGQAVHDVVLDGHVGSGIEKSTKGCKWKIDST